MNMGQNRQMQMVGGNGGNQFKQYAGQNVGNQNGYNAVQNIRNQVVQNAIQNLGVQNVRNQNRFIVVPRIANQNPNGNGHLVRNYTVKPRRRDAAYLQTQLLIAQKEEAGIQLQASTSGTQTDKAHVYDSDGSAEVIQICLWCIDSGCSKHMTWNLKLLINFVWKFLGTVRFGNDHVAAILGFGDLQWGNILITKV
ncbi:hypothetical protein Tco_0676588, partial [Tanacetum coccineum]